MSKHPKPLLYIFSFVHLHTLSIQSSVVSTGDGRISGHLLYLGTVARESQIIWFAGEDEYFSSVLFSSFLIIDSSLCVKSTGRYGEID